MSTTVTNMYATGHAFYAQKFVMRVHTMLTSPVYYLHIHNISVVFRIILKIV